jgi:hypothetical protein
MRQAFLNCQHSSGKQSFDNGTKKSQDTIALGTMYRW